MDDVIFRLPEATLWQACAGVRLGADGCLYAVYDDGRDSLTADLAQYMNDEITQLIIATRGGSPLEARLLDDERRAPEKLRLHTEVDQLRLERGRDIRVYLRHLGAEGYVSVLTHERGWNHPDVSLSYSDVVIAHEDFFVGRVFDGAAHLRPTVPLGHRSRPSPLAAPRLLIA